MSELLHKIRHMIIGTVDIKFKYMIICFGLAGIHLIFAIAFGLGQIMPLFIYNIGVTIFYICISLVAFRKEHYNFAVFSVYAEILICAVLSCLMLGWDWGFSMYTLSMVPASFYLAYTLPTIKNKILIPTLMSAGIGVCYILTRVVCGRITPLYSAAIHYDNMQICFYYFNIIIAFVVLLLFSTMFATEMIYMQKQLEQENVFLGEVANIDPLTRLLNRRSMNAKMKNYLEVAKQNNSQFCFALLDIDDFKRVNDTYGHDCGDEVLVSIAQIISNDVRESDAVCRWGGEEILLVIDANLETAKKVTERICQNVRDNEVAYNDTSVKVTLTVGLSEYMQDKTLRDMFEEADQNMYYGKKHGKNQIVTSYDRTREEVVKG